MASVNPVVKRAPQGAQSVATAKWVLANADTGVAVDLTDYADRSVQVDGIFGSATVVVEGSNDGTTWFTLRDPQGLTLSFTANGLKQIMETTMYLRASSSGGTGTTVNVTLLARKSSPKAWS